MNTIVLTTRCHRIVLMTLAASTVMLCSQRVLAQQTGLSDSLVVDIGPNGGPTGVPQVANLLESDPQQFAAIPLPGVLITHILPPWCSMI